MPDTRLSVPDDIKDRIDVEAKADRRTYKGEILALVEEALDARDKKAARK